MLSVLLAYLTNEEDRVRFTAVYLAHRDAVVRAARRALADKSLCEDCAEDAFLYLAKHFERFRTLTDEEIGAYLVTTAKSNAYAENDRRSRGPFSLDGEGAREIPDDAFPDAVRHEELVDAVERLPDGYRELFLLRYLHGYDVKELCAQFAMKPSTVYRRLEAAKAALVEALRDGEGDEDA